MDNRSVVSCADRPMQTIWLSLLYRNNKVLNGQYKRHWAVFTTALF